MSDFYFAASFGFFRHSFICFLNFFHNFSLCCFNVGTLLDFKHVVNEVLINPHLLLDSVFLFMLSFLHLSTGRIGKSFSPWILFCQISWCCNAFRYLRNWRWTDIGTCGYYLVMFCRLYIFTCMDLVIFNSDQLFCNNSWYCMELKNISNLKLKREK